MIALAALLALQGPTAAYLGQPPIDPGLAGSNWTIVAVGGAAVNGNGYTLSFAPQQISGRSGCNTFSAEYSAATATLTVGAMRSTRMACAPAVMAREQRILSILTGAVRFSRPDATTLVLAGEEGAIRLRRAN